jgi:GNAT superfamily N-acetyltransferase
MTGIRMDRSDIETIPEAELPDGYSFHWYQADDEKLWIDIHRDADGMIEGADNIYRKQFAHGTDELPQRQVFMLDKEGAAVGTASAWFDPDDAENWGRIHWVAIVPMHQGRGLAKPLLSCVMQRLKELGHKKVYLTTNAHRLPAINLYLKYGFKPAIKNDEEHSKWQEVATGLPQLKIS